jgi:aspartate aminotransferase
MISKRIAKIAPSPTLFITAKAKALKKNGVDVISLSAGEPDFDTPDYIKKAAIKALADGQTKYTPTSGILELKNAICEKLWEDNNLKYSAEEILVSVGAKQCLYNIIQALINPNDEVLIPPPFWASYVEMVKLAGGKAIFPKTKNFKIDLAEFSKFITPKTKLLILNSPGNPAGAVYEKNELEKIAGLCVKNNIFVLSDEIYEKLVYKKNHISIASLGEKIKNLTFVVNGFSKSYSMTGWRIGYAAGNKEIIKAATNLQDHSTSNATSISQYAALEALVNKSQSKKFIDKMKKEFEKRRDYIVARLSAIKGVSINKPDGAFYVFPDVSKFYSGNIKNSADFSEILLEKAHVAVIPGSAFGDDRCIRLSFAAGMKDIEKGMNRFENFVLGLTHD